MLRAKARAHVSPQPGQSSSPAPWCHPPTPGSPLRIQAPTPSTTPVANGGLTPSMDSWARGCHRMQRGGLIFWNFPGHPQNKNIGNQRESSRSDNLRSLEISLEDKCGLKINTAPGPAVLPGTCPTSTQSRVQVFISAITHSPTRSVHSGHGAPWPYYTSPGGSPETEADPMVTRFIQCA